MPARTFPRAKRRRIAAVTLAVAAALLLPSAPSYAALPDDPDPVPAGTEVISVVVPARSAAPSPTPTGGVAADGALPGTVGDGSLPGTGGDSATLWAALTALIAGLGAVAVGGGLLAAGRRRTRP